MTVWVCNILYFSKNAKYERSLDIGSTLTDVEAERKSDKWI